MELQHGLKTLEGEALASTSVSSVNGGCHASNLVQDKCPQVLAQVIIGRKVISACTIAGWLCMDGFALHGSRTFKRGHKTFFYKQPILLSIDYFRPMIDI